MALEFDIRKYNPEGNNLVDGSDALANQRDQVISFQNIRNKESVFFKAFITAFSDTYSPNFNGVEVFGRTDAIQQYKGTSRSITLAFKVPAASESEAFENLGRAGKLIQMLYPSYADLNAGKGDINALTLSEAPLVRLKVMNLLSKEHIIKDPIGIAMKEGDIKMSHEGAYVMYRSTAAPDQGILGAITSCTVNHGLESEGAFPKLDSTNTILPKLIEINVSFTPIHEETIGFTNVYDESGDATGDITNRAPAFPYGVLLKSSVNPASQGKPPSEKNKLNEDLETKRQAAASAQQAEDLARAQLEKAARKTRRKVGTKKQKEKRAIAESEAANNLIEAINNTTQAEQELSKAAQEFGYL
jgi:hypothetical protein